MSSTLIHYQRNLDPEQGVGAVHRTALQVFPLLTPSENVSAFILHTAIPIGEEVCSGAAVAHEVLCGLCGTGPGRAGMLWPGFQQSSPHLVPSMIQKSVSRRLCFEYRKGWRFTPPGTVLTDRLLIGCVTCNGLETEKPTTRRQNERLPLCKAGPLRHR